MRILDTYSGMTEAMARMGEQFSLKIWEGYIQTVSPSLLEKLRAGASGYDEQRDILPVYNRLLADKEAAELAHESFCQVTDGLEEQLQTKLGADLPVTILFYMGLCNGAGWATTLDGRDAVLLGAEKIVELGWCSVGHMRGLVYHELGHIWHDTVRKKAGIPKETKQSGIGQLYQEGIAMYIEQMLCDDYSFYHQEQDGWLEWCETRKEELLWEFAGRIQRKESVRDFFGDWNRYKGRSDVGYFLGCEFVKELLRGRMLEEAALLEVPQLERELLRLAGKG